MDEPRTNPAGTDPATDRAAAGAWDAARIKHEAVRIFRRLGPAGYLTAIAASLPAIGGFVLLGTITRTAPWFRAHEHAGPILFAIGFVVLAGLAVLPTYAQSAFAGWTFGFRVGLPAAVIGVLGASLLGYAVARRASGERVVQLISEQPKWRAVYESLLCSGFWRTLLIVTLIRLPPSSPFALTNLVLASTRVGLLPYVLATVIGLAPRTGFVVFVVAGLPSVTAANPHDKLYYIAAAVLSLVAVAVIGHLANQALAKLTAGRPSAAP